MKILIDPTHNKATVKVETAVTANMLKLMGYVVELVDADNKKQGFTFVVQKDGVSTMGTKGITFVVDEYNDKPLAFNYDLKGSVEDAKMSIGSYLQKAKDLETQILTKYDVMVKAAATVEVVKETKTAKQGE